MIFFNNCLLFIVGIIIGRIVFIYFVRPILYYFPKALYHSTKGHIYWFSPFLTLMFPLVAIVLLFVAGFFFGEQIKDFLMKQYVSLGINISVVFSVISLALFKNSRKKVDAVFWLGLFKYRKNGYLPNVQD